MKKVIIYTDGACRGNGNDNAVGAYGIVMMYNGTKKEVNKAFPNTTNNKMELSAVIVALRLLKEPCVVELHSDSKYVINAINKGWLKNWQRNGWKSSDRKPVKNQDLWLQLIELLQKHQVNFVYSPGHSGIEMNERCDELANMAMDAFERSR